MATRVQVEVTLKLRFEVSRSHNAEDPKAPVNGTDAIKEVIDSLPHLQATNCGSCGHQDKGKSSLTVMGTDSGLTISYDLNTMLPVAVAADEV